MNETQRAAFVMARAAMLNAEITQMKANNDIALGRDPHGAGCYDEAAFARKIAEYQDLEYNTVFAYLQG